MNFNFSDERLLAVVAHPDDAEVQCVGTLARAKEEKAAIGIVVMCKGDRGQPEKHIPNLDVIRREEMTKAANLLGAELFFCDIGDGTLMDNASVRDQLVEIYRKFKPTLVLAHDPDDYHSDHQAASKIAEAASWFCTSKGYETTSPSLPVAPALWFMDTAQMLNFEPGFYIDITPYMALKISMMHCHKSQLSRSGDVPPLARNIELKAQTRGMQAGVESAEVFRIAPLMNRIRAW
jgi:N-acetylglucosamine malate deacetylase 1